jgi:hypothetical protein
MKANPEHPTSYVTGFVDFERHVIVDVIWGNRSIDVKRWLAGRDWAFLEAVRTVARDLYEGYRSGLIPISTTSGRLPIPSKSSPPPTAVSTRSVDGRRTKSSARFDPDPLERIDTGGQTVDVAIRLMPLQLRWLKRWP